MVDKKYFFIVDIACIFFLSPINFAQMILSEAKPKLLNFDVIEFIKV